MAARSANCGCKACRCRSSENAAPFCLLPKPRAQPLRYSVLSPGVDMRRRDFISLVGGAAAAWPRAARAQQAMPVIGFLNSGERQAFMDRLAGFYRGLNETGFVERQNVTIEYRWAGGHLANLPALAADLVRLRVSVIAATGNTPSAIAAKAATTTIPLVFISGSDPVKAGLVASMNRPGGNATGVSTTNNEIGTKRLQILRDLVPGTTRVALLVNSTNPATEDEALVLQEIAAGVGLQVVHVRASTRHEFESAFASLTQQRASALIVTADPFFNSERDRIIALAARDRVPTIYHDRVYASGGGLITYGPSLPDGYRQVGVYTGLILKGANPADLPVVQPTKFELVINLKTAKALGLMVPLIMQMTADEVIE
jgi:putative ABC transport system substrate-binding protein